MMARRDRESFDRAVRLVTDLYCGKTISARYITDKFGVCRATAHRDLHALEALLPIITESDGTATGKVLMRMEARR